MIFFSVPADFKKETVERYADINNRYPHARVHETYGNITIGNLFQSGRSVNLLPPVDILRLQEYIKFCWRYNIDFNYTLNATHMNNREFSQKGILEIINFLGKLYEAGVRSITAALPSLMDIIKSTSYDFKIKASTLCQIINANKAVAYKRYGVEKIVADESINRNFTVLKQIINRCPGEVELIANAICYKNCIYRMFHYNQMSADSVKNPGEASVNYYSHKCLLQRYHQVSDILRLTWIRPEDIKYYNAIGINHFKLQGRQAVMKGDPLRAVECYIKGAYDGNLMELLDMFDPTSNFQVFVDNMKLDGFIKPFLEKENFCRQDCPDCGYCQSFAEKCIDFKDAAEVMDLAGKFYKEYDPFGKMVEAITTQNPVTTGQNRQMTADFDLDPDH